MKRQRNHQANEQPVPIFAAFQERLIEIPKLRCTHLAWKPTGSASPLSNVRNISVAGSCYVHRLTRAFHENFGEVTTLRFFRWKTRP